MILVTGGTGFIGRPLVNSLLKKGHSVRVLTRQPESARILFPKADVLRGDILKTAALKKAVRSVDVVIHLAGLIGYKNKEKLFQVNCQGTRNLLRCCGGVNKLIYSSTMAVFGPVKGVATETTSCFPGGPYGQSKLAAEKAILKSTVPSLILRLCAVYGTGAPWWGKILRLLSLGFVPDTGNSCTQVVHVSDAARSFELGLRRGKGVFIIGDEKSVKITAMNKMLAGMLGKKPRMLPYWMASLAASSLGMGEFLGAVSENRSFDVSKARKRLKFRPRTDLRKGMRKMVEDYKKCQ